MKICFVTKSDYNIIKNIGRIRELPKELKRLGNEVSLISAVYSGEKPETNTTEDFSNISLICIGRNSFFMSVLYFLRLNLFFIRSRKVLSKTDFYILDYSSTIPLIVFLLLSRLHILKSRFILDVRTIPVEVTGIKKILAYAEYDIAIKTASLLCDGITAITGEISKDIGKRGYNRNKKIGIWASGVNTSVFNLNTTPLPLQGFANADDFVIMHHGVLSLSRGLIETVKAIPIVLRSGIPVKLLIIGDGPAKGHLEKYIEENNLGDNIMLTGTVPHDELPGYIAACNAGIIPLPNINWWRVSSPQKLFEYLAMGKNVIVSDITAHRSILNDREFAFYIKEVTPECIADSIIGCNIQCNGKKINSEAAVFAELNHTWKYQAQKLNKFLVGI